MPITSLKQLEEATARDVRDDFNEWGWKHPQLTWQDALKRLAPAYGLLTPAHKRMNRAAVKILVVCKKPG